MKRFLSVLLILGILIFILPTAMAEEETIDTLKHRIAELEEQLAERDALIAELCSIISNFGISSEEQSTETLDEESIETDVEKAQRLYNEGNYQEAREIYSELGMTLSVQECDKSIYLQNRTDFATEFAGKLLAACADAFSNPSSIVVTGAWYYNSMDASRARDYSRGEEINDWNYGHFTFQLTVTNSFGNTHSVYYGSAMLIKMDDDTLSSIGRCVWAGKVNGSNWNGFMEEGKLEAMQKGIELDVDQVQQFFLQNYK